MRFHLLIFAVDVVGMFAALLIGLRLLGANPRHPTSQLLALLCLNSICARLLARHEYAFWIPDVLQFDVGSIETALNLARNLTPGFFMIVCHRLFQETRTFPRWLAAAFLLQALCEDALPAILGVSASSQHSALEIAPALSQLLFIGQALSFIARGWRTDMVETRRRLRVIFLFVLGSHVLTVVLLERILIPWSQPMLYEIHVWLSVFGAVLACVALFALLGADISWVTDPCHTPRVNEAERRRALDRDELDLVRLQAVLRKELAYRDPTLTLPSLARRLKLPEYRLRALIHERLGYRNFNALLHDYRIKEVSAALADPNQRNVPILTLALSAGYNSINPFNRAFRDATGMTPSSFRARALREPLGER
jgi:AraC-like DNA-binding protein